MDPTTLAIVVSVSSFFGLFVLAFLIFKALSDENKSKWRAVLNFRRKKEGEADGNPARSADGNPARRFRR